MLRRQALTLGSLLLGAVTLGGWTLFKQKDKKPATALGAGRW